MTNISLTTTAQSIATTILNQAMSTGTATWTKIQTAMRVYVQGYAQTLIDIARGVLDRNITADEAKQYAHNSLYLFAQSIANMVHIVLFEVQTFINGLLNTLRNTINGMLGGLALV